MRDPRTNATLWGIVHSIMNHNSSRLLGALLTIAALGAACSTDGNSGINGIDGGSCHTKQDGNCSVVYCDDGSSSRTCGSGGSNVNTGGGNSSGNSVTANFSGVWVCGANSTLDFTNQSDQIATQIRQSNPQPTSSICAQLGSTQLKAGTYAILGSGPAHIVVQSGSPIIWGLATASNVLSGNQQNGVVDATYGPSDGFWVEIVDATAPLSFSSQ